MLFKIKRKRAMGYSTIIKQMQKRFDSAKTVGGSVTLECLFLCILGVHEI